MQESYYRADFRTAGRPIQPLSLRERLNRLMTRSLFTIEEDCDCPQTAHLAFTTKQGWGQISLKPESRGSADRRERKGQCFGKWEGLEERTGNRREHSCSNQSLSTPYIKLKHAKNHPIGPQGPNRLKSLHNWKQHLIHINLMIKLCTAFKYLLLPLRPVEVCYRFKTTSCRSSQNITSFPMSLAHKVYWL